MAFSSELRSADVLAREVPWETYMTARLISDRDLQLIRRYDKKATDVKNSLLEEDGPAYVEAFLMVLRNVTKEETVQYVLALLDEMLAVNPGRAVLFFQQSEQHMSSLPDPYTLFVRLLQRSDWFTQQKACRLLAIILDCRPGGAVAAAAPSIDLLLGGSSNTVAVDGVEQVVVSFVDWLCSQLRRPAHPSQSVPTAVSALACLLKEQGVRVLFHRGGGVALLAPLVRAGSSSQIQLLYETGLCMWQLSYNLEACRSMLATGVISGLVDLTKSAQKEKVVRVALLTLKNLLGHAELEGAGAEMVELGFAKVLATRSLQSWADEDVPELLAHLDEKLKDHIQVSSSFDKYKNEVLSGTLEWSPMHTSEAFWLENVEKFEEKDFQVLRVLLKLLEASREPRSLAVGCHDLGQFMLHHPHGRYIVQDLNGKSLVMRLMVHPEPEVQKQALLCVQKMMLTKDKLEFLSSSRSSTAPNLTASS